jgi:hypothetical protein
VSRTEHELEVEVDGKTYLVNVEVEWRKVDDSFDGHLYGRPYTFEDHHFEPEEWEVCSCIDIDTDEEVDSDEVPGLAGAIGAEVNDLDQPDL